MTLNCERIEVLESLGEKKKDTKPTERLETLAEVPQWSPTSRKCSPIRSHKEDLEDG